MSKPSFDSIAVEIIVGKLRRDRDADLDVLRHERDALNHEVALQPPPLWMSVVEMGGKH